jgi:hypothetical protein
MKIALLRAAVLLLALAAPASAASIWTDGHTPASTSTNTAAREVGLRFRAIRDGVVTGIRYYKASANTGTHTGSLWAMDGTLLARVTFVGESAAGWQEAAFPEPVAVLAGVTFVVSVHCPAGRYSYTNASLTSNIDSGYLTALANGGVYRLTGSPAYPSTVSIGRNYWVDVVYEPAATGPVGRPIVNPITWTANLTLAWKDNSTNEDGFDVEQSLDAPGAFAKIATVPANVVTYNVQAIPFLRIHCWRVRAVNAAGASGYTNTVCGRVTADAVWEGVTP